MEIWSYTVTNNWYHGNFKNVTSDDLPYEWYIWQTLNLAIWEEKQI